MINDPKKIIVAFDVPDLTEANRLAKTLRPELCRAKVGSELFTACGPDAVKLLMDRGYEVFLDLKFHDNPRTVANAVQSAARLGVWMTNVHASGSLKMMKAAMDTISELERKLLLIGVTVLTGMDSDDLQRVGITPVSPLSQVVILASLAHKCGLDGVVASGQEARMIRNLCGEKFCIVTPGVRFQAVKGDDQKRTTTPERAVADGANYLVVGRPITQAEDPLSTLQAFHDQANRTRPYKR